MRLPVLDQPPATRPAHFDTGPKSIGAVRVLRISVTDRCNFRCVYCMPEEGVRWLAKADMLSFEEITQIVRAAIEVHGIRRFKLTGGEPTVRQGIADLVGMLRSIDGVEDLSLTTNGALLDELAEPLRQAGLDRVTVSLDSLQPDRFRRITRTGDLAAVLRGLDRCERVGLGSLKVNCVTMRGTNDDELAEFARLTLSRRLTVRFIEYMPLGDAALMHVSANKEEGRRGEGWQGPRVDDQELGPAGGCGAQDRGGESFISETEVRARIEDAMGPLVPVDRDSEAGVGPASIFRLARGDPLGRIGFISAMSAPFCSTCNRLRLTANGVLRSCLFEGGEVNVLPVLRSGRTPQEQRRDVAHAMSECVRLKPDVHSGHGNTQMSRIGG
jgi:cyclic pyranopterin phosphate synthase